MIKRTRNIVILFITISMVLMGCGKKAAEETGTTDTTAATTSPAATQADGDLKTLHFGLATESSIPTGILGLASTQGYLAEELAAVGYKIKIEGFAQLGPAVNEAIVSKALDMASYGDLPPVVLKSKGVDIKLVAIPNTLSFHNLIVAKDSDIKELKDLEGKKVIVSIGTVYQHTWRLLVDSSGIDESKVEIINDPSNAVATFTSGNADAFLTGDLNVEKINAKYPVRVIATGRDHADWGSQSALVTRTEFGKEHPEVVTALLKAYIRAYKDAEADNSLLYQSFVQDGVDLALATKVYSYYDVKNFDGDIVQENIDKVSSLNDFLFNEKLTNNKIDVNDYIDTSYYEAAKAALGEK